MEFKYSKKIQDSKLLLEYSINQRNIKPKHINFKFSSFVYTFDITTKEFITLYSINKL